MRYISVHYHHHNHHLHPDITTSLCLCHPPRSAVDMVSDSLTGPHKVIFSKRTYEYFIYVKYRILPNNVKKKLDVTTAGEP